MDSRAVDRLRGALAGTGWIERSTAFARALRGGHHEAGGLLLVGSPDHEPWHLAAHLTDQARWSAVPALTPTLVRWAPPPGAPAHLAVDLSRLEAIRRGETLVVVSPAVAAPGLLERVADARRDGALVLALQGSDPELTELAHEALVVPAAGPDLDAVGHLVTAAAGSRPVPARRLPHLLRQPRH